MKRLVLSFLIVLFMSIEGSTETIELTLKEALVLALNNNRDIKIEEFNVQGSEGLVK